MILPACGRETQACQERLDWTPERRGGAPRAGALRKLPARSARACRPRDGSMSNECKLRSPKGAQWIERNSAGSSAPFSLGQSSWSHSRRSRWAWESVHARARLLGARVVLGRSLHSRGHGLGYPARGWIHCSARGLASDSLQLVPGGSGNLARRVVVRRPQRAHTSARLQGRLGECFRSQPAEQLKPGSAAPRSVSERVTGQSNDVLGAVVAAGAHPVR
jgi:hypothetical protein